MTTPPAYGILTAAILPDGKLYLSVRDSFEAEHPRLSLILDGVTFSECIALAPEGDAALTNPWPHMPVLFTIHKDD